MAGLPTADEAFGLPTADDAFGPAPPKLHPLSTLPIVGGAFIPGGPAERIAEAFGHGVTEPFGGPLWGADPKTIDWFKQRGIFNDWQKGERSIGKALNEGVILPLGDAIDIAARAATGLFRGAQAAIAQTGVEVGQPGAGRDIAALPEAFMGAPHILTRPGSLPKEVAEHRAAGVIGEPEAVWNRSQEPTPEMLAGRADAEHWVDAWKEAERKVAEADTPQAREAALDQLAEARPGLPRSQRAEPLAAPEPLAEEAAPPGRPPEPPSGGPPEGPHGPFEPESPRVDKAGNIRLDNLNTPEDVNAVLHEIAEQNDDFMSARRGVVTDAMVEDAADAAGVDPKQFSGWARGQAWSAERVMALRKTLIATATAVRDAALKVAGGDEAALAAYIEARSRHIMVQETLAGVTAEAGRALRAFRDLGPEADAAAILKEQTGMTPEQMRAEAARLSQLDTTAKVSKYLNDMKKPGFMDMAIEVWRNALLTGLRTHEANMAGNTLSAMWSVPETVLAGVVGGIRKVLGLGGEDRIMLGEGAARLYGMLRSPNDAIRAMGAALLDEQATSGRTQLSGERAGAVPGMAGKVVRLPYRVLNAEDQLFKTFAMHSELHAQAYRQAVKEGLDPLSGAFADRVADLARNPTPEQMAKAKAYADYATFNNDLGALGKSVQNALNKTPVLKFLVPFVRTPANLVKWGMERSPAAPLFTEYRENLTGKNGDVARDTAIARVIGGTGFMLWIANMAMDGTITGGGPADDKEKAAKRLTGWRPYSVKIGDAYHQYNRLDPMSMLMGLGADAYEIHQAGHDDQVGADAVVKMMFASVLNNIGQRASLTGPIDFAKAVSDPQRYGQTWVNRFAGSMVPAALAQYTQSSDPYLREARTILDTMKSRIPGMSQELLPKRDVFGEPMKRDEYMGPIAVSRVNNDPVIQKMMDLNYFPARPQRQIRGVNISDDAFDDYSRIGGRLAKHQLDQIIAQPGFESAPAYVQRDIFSKVITKSREQARGIVMMMYPDIPKAALDARRERIAE